MSKLASRIEKLERRQPVRKVPRGDTALAEWALDSLFPSKRVEGEDVPQREPSEDEPSPFLVFLKMARSGEIERELKRRELLPAESEPEPEEPRLTPTQKVPCEEQVFYGHETVPPQERE